jgi:Fe-S-cluster formation regulator IscX/YfhJ/CRISPR/Cas system-associated exonuclease Cas4 (RecB family)
MDNLLFHIARYIYETHPDDLGDCCIVFPNRRAGLFFSQYLSEITDKPIWSPAFLTINELMQEFSDLQIADNLILVFELYKVFRDKKKTSESFDEFYYWGEMLLNDFDDIDKHLVNSNDLFQNLAALKNIQDQLGYLTENQLEAINNFWNSFTKDKYSVHQEDFIRLWDVLPEIYNLFNQNLNQKKIAYEGMIYRQVAENIRGKTNLDLTYKTYIFIGFNALNVCEEILFDFLKKENRAEFFWDYDEYYLKNQFHEAGFFIRKNLKKFPSQLSNFTFNRLTETDKKIEIISVPSDVGQTKLINQLLQKIHKPESINYFNTAVVLADEYLLMPVLFSIPEEIKEINVTMGYPVKDTPVFSLVTKLIELQQYIKTSSGGSCRFYYKLVLSILNHQYITCQEINEVEILINSIISQNKIYLTQEELGTQELLNLIFRKVESPEEMSAYLMEILYYMFDKIETEEAGRIDSSGLHKEYIYNIYTSVNKLKEILKEKKVKVSLETYFKLLNKIIENIKIPFTGEPLAGLQVMGLLETRVLDFENLVILSMNEGILPKTTPPYSFIPYNLRKGFGLPTIEHQDSIFAYYFYRLIQRAKNIYLLYNSSQGDMRTGEMSRFLTQLKLDPVFNITEKDVSFEIKMIPGKPISISKSLPIMEMLDTFHANSSHQRYISPSAINTWLDCSLKFYFRYIASIEEPAEVFEDVDFVVFGNLLHRTINSLYHRFGEQTIQPKDLVDLKKESVLIEKAITRAFEEEFTGDRKSYSFPFELTGRNIITKEILKKYIYQILEVDIRFAPFSITGLEKFYKYKIPVRLPGGRTEIFLGGHIDRIDRKNNIFRIIDYKTGKASNSFPGIKSLFQKGDRNRNKAVFQTFIYSLLFVKNNPGIKIKPGLYITKEIFKDNFDATINLSLSKNKKVRVENFSDIADDFLLELKRLFEELFNQDIEFRQVDDIEICKTCPYAMICHREDVR